jgi:hypothetical protein
MITEKNEKNRDLILEYLLSNMCGLKSSEITEMNELIVPIYAVDLLKVLERRRLVHRLKTIGKNIIWRASPVFFTKKEENSNE